MPPRRPVLLAMLTLMIATGLPAARAAAAPLRLDAYSPWTRADTPPVAGRTRLTRGGLYVATVRGTFSFYPAIDYLAPQPPFQTVCGRPGPAPLFGSAGGAGEVSDDAQFILAYPSRRTSCAGYSLPHPWFNFQADAGGGWEHPALLAGGAVRRPTHDHLYHYALVGRGAPARFRLVDPDTRDDYGALEISVRRAAPSDCAGPRYRAFGLASRSACTARARGREPAASPGSPTAPALPESPVARVLRNSDVPSAANRQLPSGALAPAPLSRLLTGGAAAARTLSRSLDRDGAVDGAVSAYTGGGLPRLTSTSVLYRSAAAATAGDRTELAEAAAGAPAGAVASAPAAGTLSGAAVITFTASGPSGSGGEEVVLQVGDVVDTLEAVEAPDRVSDPAIEALLSRVAGRS